MVAALRCITILRPAGDALDVTPTAAHRMTRVAELIKRKSMGRRKPKGKDGNGET